MRASGPRRAVCSPRCPRRSRCGSRSSPPSANRGPRPAASRTWWMRSRGRSGNARSGRPMGSLTSSTSTSRTTAGCRFRPARARFRCAFPTRSRRPARPTCACSSPRRTATGCTWSTTRPRSIATGCTGRPAVATIRTTPGGSRSCVAPRWSTFVPAARPAVVRSAGRHPHPRLARRAGGAAAGTRSTATTRRLGGAACSSRSTTSRTTAGRRFPRSRSSGWALPRSRRSACATASTCCAPPSIAPSW